MCNELKIFAYPHPVTADHLAATNQIHGIKNDNRINFIEKTIQKMYSCRKIAKNTGMSVLIFAM